MAKPSLFKGLLNRPAGQITMAVILFLALTVLADRFLRGWQLDLTADNLYTLSDGTETLLASLDEPVVLEYYFSRNLAAPYGQLLGYGKRVEDTLRAVVAASDGMVKLSVIDPEPFSEAEDDAVAAGLKGVPMADGSTLYMGLKASNSLDGEAVIPFFTTEREKFLEYDLVKLIAGFNTATKKNLTLLTSLPMQFGPGGAEAMMSGRAQPYVLYEQLSEFFNLQEIAEDFSEIPAETDVLMVVHPPALNDDQLFLIDQYVLKGGRALIFLDPHAEAANPRAYAPSASTLGPLLGAWGVAMPEGKVVGDAALAQRVQMGGLGPDSVKDYVFWLGINHEFMTDDDIVTGSIDNLNFATSGVLEQLDGATTQFQPLVTTSAASMLFDASRAVGMPEPDRLLKDLKPTGISYTLSARVSGPAKTAFSDKAAADAGPVNNPSVSEGDINIVLTADTDIFDDRFWVQLQELLGQRIVVPIAGNGSFILNLAEHIVGSEALLGLRGRGIAKRPFTVVDSLRREAETKYLAEEEALQKQLQNTEMRISELEAQEPEGGAILSTEQEAEIEGFRGQLLETRKALREVNRSLRAEIVGLGKWLAFINIALVPVLIILIVLIRLWLLRRRTAE
ncbi:GldG family protein [Kordiimonas pumila]|uniref:GldG family protein n=1 Tax=Kordiimonas pumila TaxID=2161677 RepID=A0ABV7D0C2_9PROT|nr:Gldg family protein [Kordiimonas pumila]